MNQSKIIILHHPTAQVFVTSLPENASHVEAFEWICSFCAERGLLIDNVSYMEFDGNVRFL